MVTATVSSKNQIVLPKDILTILGVECGDKLIVYTDESEIRMKPVRGSIVDLVAGSIKIAESKRGVPFEKVMKVVRKKIAKKLANND